MSKVKLLLGPVRLPFLFLAIACALLGLGTAVWSSGQVQAIHVILAFVGALCAHMSVNLFNEYFDFKSGLDYRTARTPFSGGSGTLPEYPELAGYVLVMGVFTSLITSVVGIYFLSIRGLSLLLIGVLGLFLIVTYTPLFTRNPVFCLIAPGLGFGPLMVMGVDFALTGIYSWTAFIASLVPFFLVNNLLLLNQFPDVDADLSVKRRHFPMVIGRRPSSLIYAGFIILAFLSMPLGVVTGHLPLGSMLGLLALLIAIPTTIGAYRNAEDVEQLMPYLGMNVLINIGTPILIAIGLFLG